jgi:hypothetical protein
MASRLIVEIVELGVAIGMPAALNGRPPFGTGVG